ncbi:TetR/AcrR family transcriptional regulator [Bacillus infantis]|jgi:AcrR family transcriptional regulator|uniref:TetR/AcrR family transcriptional regulator n=1 Tax=Bacillus infantis TaxID=324767 RepID=UPI0021554B4D|nr:TetR/AcrR family transcriptional regulator [Bacillus infantis]MCR6613383.1 TetR/AcrR family transcriptional regulator [Bacillus infantis]
MSNQKEEKVDPRIIRSKRMFKEALVSLLQENGDQSKLTVQKLADRAELNRATFYLHYQDIEDLKEQMVDEALQELTETLHPLYAENEDQTTPPIVSFLEHIYEHADLFNVMLESKDFRSKLFDIITGIISTRRETRKGKGRSPQVPIEIIASSTFGIVSWWIQKGMPYTPGYLAEQINLVFRNSAHRSSVE